MTQSEIRKTKLSFKEWKEKNERYKELEAEIRALELAVIEAAEKYYNEWNKHRLIPTGSLSRNPEFEIGSLGDALGRLKAARSREE